MSRAKERSDERAPGHDRADPEGPRDPRAARTDEGTDKEAPALIVIDHLQLLATGEDAGSRRAALDGVLRQCQDWVGDGYTVIALSQFSRTGYGQRPRLAHFKESSAIEAAASVALGLWQQS